ncbi:hypothetical protein [Modestobacter lacusdianchii]
MTGDRRPSASRGVVWALLALVWVFLAGSRFSSDEQGWGWLSLLLAAAWAGLAVREWLRWRGHRDGAGRRDAA